MYSKVNAPDNLMKTEQGVCLCTHELITQYIAHLDKKTAQLFPTYPCITKAIRNANDLVIDILWSGVH